MVLGRSAALAKMESSPREEAGEAMYPYTVIEGTAAVQEEIRRIEEIWKVAFDEPVEAATTKIEVWATSVADGDADKVDFVLFDHAGKELARREIPGY